EPPDGRSGEDSCGQGTQVCPGRGFSQRRRPEARGAQEIEVGGTVMSRQRRDKDSPEEAEPEKAKQDTPENPVRRWPRRPGRGELEFICVLPARAVPRNFPERPPGRKTLH